jgi:hypothetical protein
VVQSTADVDIRGDAVIVPSDLVLDTKAPCVCGPPPGPSRVIPFDLSKALGVDYKATSPNLLAAYVRVLPKEKVETQACATSQAFYVIRGG